MLLNACYFERQRILSSSKNITFKLPRSNSNSEITTPYDCSPQ